MDVLGEKVVEEAVLEAAVVVVPLLPKVLLVPLLLPGELFGEDLEEEWENVAAYARCNRLCTYVVVELIVVPNPALGWALAGPYLSLLLTTLPVAERVNRIESRVKLMSALGSAWSILGLPNARLSSSSSSTFKVVMRFPAALLSVSPYVGMLVPSSPPSNPLVP
jgi:hypothetical protein